MCSARLALPAQQGAAYAPTAAYLSATAAVLISPPTPIIVERVAMPYDNLNLRYTLD
jgi:hypothetical protein